jgi:hypothetical protein
MFWNNFVRRPGRNHHGDAGIDVRESGGWGDMTSAKDYRRYATECMTLAERVKDPADKARLVKMAQDFMELAERRRREGDASDD